jgi:hypothetical protein
MYCGHWESRYAAIIISGFCATQLEMKVATLMTFRPVVSCAQQICGDGDIEALSSDSGLELQGTASYV